MSAKKDTYTAVRAALLAIATLKTVRLYNSQFLNLEKEATFELPAALVEFVQLSYTAKAKGIQEADTTVRIHVAYNSLLSEDTAILDIMDEIQGVLQGFTSTAPHGPLNRTNETQDINHDAVSVWTMDYTTLITDVSGCTDSDLVEATLNGFIITANASKPWLKLL